MSPRRSTALLNFYMSSCLLLLATSALTINLTTAQGQVHCPSADDANSSCDPETLFVRHDCCGEMQMFCCMRIKQWVWLSGIGFLALVVIFVSGCCIRCFMNRKNQQSYDFP